ncbi:O-succinylhomoserine sulfhydrylase [Lishizhenia tianjinensis]|uniref:O-succinylhomoserine sulfhydrylase n=1 Tax=Lishizhenia tianjinensis TaxID=477690 RepID=A0A1I6YS85_9FLAO|nr:aminotransferase class I/II-fold pyridoxal phosphate-dependent enzyme [Lishizhenia tianjinensis]SFT53091.1 O-succinylhomoserine sulfhydrylase [Lishizhenia tianjinensis]
MRDETLAIRLQNEKSPFGEHSTPLYLTSSYAFENAEHMRALFADEQEGNIYSRYSNPSVSEFIDKMCRLEKTEAGFATASGMAAVFSTFGALLEKGDHVVSCSAIFGSTHKLFTEILPKWGIHTSYVGSQDYEGFERAILPTTKLVYVETPSNPGLDIVDLERLGEICKKHGLLLVVDNCFATPIIQKPIEFGADIVIHSATKWIDGQGRTMGGVILSTQEIIKKVEGFARHTGPCLSPFNAWVLSKSLETLALRIEKHSANAASLAERLAIHPAVETLKYPHFRTHPQYALAKKQMRLGGGIVSFEIKGGLSAGRKFLDALQMLSLTANLGDTRSIATHPASTTHSKLTPEDRASVGISDGLIRLSVGLEHLEDIVADVFQALEVSQKK